MRITFALPLLYAGARIKVNCVANLHANVTRWRFRTSSSRRGRTLHSTIYCGISNFASACPHCNQTRSLKLDTRTQEPTFRPALRDVPWYVALGTLGIGISQSLVFVGNHLVGAAYAPIMVPTTPVYVALLSAAFGMEAFNRYKARRCVAHTVGAASPDPRTLSVVSVASSAAGSYRCIAGFSTGRLLAQLAGAMASMHLQGSPQSTCHDAQAAGIVMSVSGALVLVHVENLDFHKCARYHARP